MEQNSKRRKIQGGKWTSDANGSVKYSGWNDKGLQQFNELCEVVNENRTKFPEFNKNYLVKIPKMVKTQFANSQLQNKHSKFMMTWNKKFQFLQNEVKAWKLPAETVMFVIYLVIE